ncbi:energy transducer TonB [Hydrogenophaga sp. RWCD_12]|uniref:energy transducer TonB n=1 Tax=Hydrogenophaga sp. RWCD_12 TaxID=3391190 RepID=UPI0039855FEF
MNSAVLGSHHIPAAQSPQGATNHPPRMDRRLLIVATVIGLHVAGLWALQAGLLQRAVELVVPVSVVADLIEPPQPQVTPEPTPPKPAPAPKPLAPAPRVAQSPAPMPLAVADPKPAPQAPTGVVAPQPVAPAAPAVTEAAPTKPAPAPARISNDVRDNFQDLPAPPYPPTSVRMNEQGSVLLAIKVESNGTASSADVVRSSGFPRLDDAAVKAALRWRYVPRGGGSPRPDTYQYVVRFELN